MRKNKLYDISADIIHIIGALAVVSIHVTDSLVVLPNHFGGISWWWANTINSFSRIAVPLFIMVSGYLYLDSKKTLSDNFFQKRSLKLVVPFVFWFCFYLFWNQYHNQQKFVIASLLYDFFTLSIGPLYFLIIIYLLSLITPNIKKYIQNKTVTSLLRSMLSIFFLAFTTITAIYLFPSFRFFVNIITQPFFFLGYYLYGNIVRKINIDKKILNILLIITIMATALTTILTYLNTRYRIIWVDNYGQYFHESFSPLIIGMSLSVFTILIKLKKSFQIKLPKFIFFIKFLSGSTFTIYLIHPLVIDLVNTYLHMNIHEMNNALWFWISIKIVVVFIISLLIAEIFHR